MIPIKQWIHRHLVVYGVTLTLKNSYHRSPHNLIERYGKGSYVILTGLQNLMAQQLCLKFAKLGFNFVLFDQSLEELDEMKRQIIKVNDKVLVKTMKYNFENGINPDYYKEISDSLASFDVSILINNSGTQKKVQQQFHQMENDELLKLFYLKNYSSIFMIKSLITQMKLRKKRSLILQISCKGASRGMMNSVLNSIELENGKSNIDVISLNPDENQMNDFEFINRGVDRIGRQSIYMDNGLRGKLLLIEKEKIDNDYKFI